VWKLVGLHADQADQGLAAGAADVGNDAVRPHPGVGLVVRLDQDLDVRPENRTAPAIFGQAVERRQGVGWDVGSEPSDWIAVVVVVRRLDQDQMELCTLLHGTAHCGISPRQSPRAALLERLPPLNGIPSVTMLCDALQRNCTGRINAISGVQYCTTSGAFTGRATRLARPAHAKALIAVRGPKAHGRQP